MDGITEFVAKAREHASAEPSRAQVYAILALATAVQNMAKELGEVKNIYRNVSIQKGYRVDG